MTVYIIIFIIFAFLGWIIDSTYRSIGNKKFVMSGYYKNLPFCPIYGFGGLLLINTFIQLQGLSSWKVVLITTAFIIILEYVGGWFCDHILKEKLWDYSNTKYNLNGYVNLLKSSYWLILITVLYFLSAQVIGNISTLITNTQRIFDQYDIYISSIFLISVISFTIHTKDKRLAMINNKKVEKLENMVNDLQDRLKRIRI